MEHPKFVIKKSGRHFYFELTAANGDIMLSSELLDGLTRLVSRHPATTFIGAHVA